MFTERFLQIYNGKTKALLQQRNVMLINFSTTLRRDRMMSTVAFVHPPDNRNDKHLLGNQQLINSPQMTAKIIQLYNCSTRPG